MKLTEQNKHWPSMQPEYRREQVRASYARNRVRRVLAQRDRQSTMRQRAFDYKGGRCTDCGYADNMLALQFDHVPERGAKKAPVAKLYSLSWEVLVMELDKCDLVCANCHAIRTHGRGQQFWRSRRLDIQVKGAG